MGRDFPSAKRLSVPASLFPAWARRTRPSASAAIRTSSLCGPPFPPTSASSSCTRAERLAVGAHHRRAQLVQPRPRRLVGAKAHDALEILRRDPGAPRADLEHRTEPHLERLARLLQQRAGREARLTPAFGTLEQEAIALAPHPRALAAGAGRLAAPASLDPIGPTVCLGREPRLELRRRLRKVTPQGVVVLLRHGPTPGWLSCRTKFRRNYGDRHAPSTTLADLLEVAQGRAIFGSVGIAAGVE